MASQAQVLSRFSYPKVPGDSPWSVLDLNGPASYTVVTVGTPATGGQTVLPSAFGLQSFDFVLTMASNNGQYDVTVIPQPAAPGNSLSGVTLLWSVAATGAQVTAATNLSTFSVRLLAIGR